MTKCKICGQVIVNKKRTVYCSVECELRGGSDKMIEQFHKNGKHKRLKLRFDIFQRDNFTCQYCGRKVPEVILEIDHKYPKAKGGENKISNYVTACRDCNIGKRDTILKTEKQ